MAYALLSGIRGLLAGIYGPWQQTDGSRRVPATRLARKVLGTRALPRRGPSLGSICLSLSLWNPNFGPMKNSVDIHQGPFAACLFPNTFTHCLALPRPLDFALAQAWLGVASPWMQSKGACSNITDANFIAILQQGIGYQVSCETGTVVRALRSTSGSIPKSRYFVHVFGFALATHACASPIAPKPQAKFFPFFTPDLVLAAAACCSPGVLFYTVLRPHLGLAGPAKAPSALRLMQLQTSNSQKSDSLVGTWRWLTLASTWHHTLLRLCHTVSVLFLPPSRRPRFGCPSHCLFSSL
ncbi:hypothetical protein BDP55DRAFT_717719 [Colletotrichum godetiae]|uniref:Uncharacterized protein n=1 Tax=Colletotrichum godetiae TaxID=1209918 RepID=A0AAJ0ERP5_9PEZI|nr:uncharacterized protein BDP55DRAFT_717719 [Colletotrichum godetiae]KAK1673012.1 hypothetical protein BDP55DRAFT_717719 [Colletotrichum godetiae]